MTTSHTVVPGVPRLLLTGALGMAFVAGSTVPAQALDLPPRPSEGAVQDQADVLSTDQEADLNRLIGRKNEDNEHIRAAVLTVNDTQGESIENFSREVATQWGVGQDGRNNGVLLVADMGGRKLRIEVADGARAVLPDTQAQGIMARELQPGFKDGKYAEAFTNTLIEVYDRGEPQAAAASPADRMRTIMGAVAAMMATVVAVIAIVFGVSVRRNKRIRAQADREIDQFQREHPEENITKSMRRAYYGYRQQNRNGPGLNETPRKVKDKDGVEREIPYAPTFHTWLPLYAMFPSIYSGVTNSSVSFTSGSDSTYGGGASSSFGGGGGFSGGGASGSF